MADANVLIPDTVTSVKASESCTILDPVGSTSGMNAVQFHQFLWYLMQYSTTTVILCSIGKYRYLVKTKEKRSNTVIKRMPEW